MQLVPFEEKKALAKAVADSQLFGIKTEAQALVLMALCEAEGMPAVVACRDYSIIQGRPAKTAEAMLRSYLAAGGKIEWHRLDDECADATFSHPQGGTVRISWDMKRAKAAGLGGKDMWSKYPRQMLRSRTISEGCRTVWPASTGGLYVPEEAADMEPKDITPRAEVLPPEKPGIANKLKAAAAKIDRETGEIERPGLELSGEVTMAEYIAQAGTLEELQGFQADVAALDAKSADGKVARLAYNKRLAELTPQEQTA